MSKFKRKLRELINQTSMESGSNTPDFILAQYLKDCLKSFDRAIKDRERFYGRELYATDTPLEVNVKSESDVTKT